MYRRAFSPPLARCRRAFFPSSLEEGCPRSGRGGAPGWSAHSFDDPHVALDRVAGQVLERLLVAGDVVRGERLLHAGELDQDHPLIYPGLVYFCGIPAHQTLAARGL